ncbi:Angio-associated migratory cell protein [Dichanthelium oligosanthes]|uniref:Angio-associated migratory cell protein n=1 Tax=Dichanthelium oligosanthes TaxID=888268 RepID=A0A1E5VKY6_9POAL|nr:Angio-associated migratory cell protein [Dichanthelium oligosanthes]
MSISGELPGEGSDGEEEVFVNEEDIIHEITVDDEDLPDRDDEDEDGGDAMGDSVDVDDSTYMFQSHKGNPTDASLVASGGKDDRGFLWRIGSADGALELTEHYMKLILFFVHDCIEETYRTVVLNTGHNDTVSTVAFSSDGNLLACGSFDGQINVWSTATRALQGTLEGSGSGFEWLKWHPRGHLIIAGSEDCNVWMWNADHNAILNTFAGHSSTVTCGDFTPDGKLICTGSDDASLRIWDPRSAQSRHVVRGHGYHTDGLTCLAITLDSQTVVSGSKDNSVHIVNVNSGQVVGSLVGHTNSIECVGISSSYGWAATGSMDQKLIIWDAAHQSSRCTCEHDEGVTSLAWLGSSRYVASGCIDGKVRIWDSLSGDCAREFSGHADVVQSLAVTADGNAMVSVSSDGSARVFDISMFK